MRLQQFKWIVFITVLMTGFIMGCTNSNTSSTDQKAVDGKDKQEQAETNQLKKRDLKSMRKTSADKDRAKREESAGKAASKDLNTSNPSSRQGKINPGDEIRVFSASTVDGKTLNLTDYKDKIVLLDFWATWCKPCRYELPHMAKLAEEYSDSDKVAIIGISLDRDKEAVKKFVDNYKLNYPNVFDGKMWKNDVAILYGVNSIPFTIILKDGKVYKTGLRGKQLVEEIGNLVKG